MEGDQDFRPPNLSWPTSTGISESQAENYCSNALRQSQLWPHCQDKRQEIEGQTENCKIDILVANNYTSTEAIVEAFQTNCKVELAKDPDNYITTPGGESVLKPEISNDVCNPVCYINGRCDRGQCVCNRGFIGDNCQIKDEPPKLLGLRGSNLCDFNERPCKQIFINAENIQNTATMACKIQEILDDGSVSEQASMEEAVFLTLNKLGCALPDAGIKTATPTRSALIFFLHSIFFNCGTTVPIWLRGTHPSVSDGIQTRQACANLQTGGASYVPCCGQAVNIGGRTHHVPLASGLRQVFHPDVKKSPSVIIISPLSAEAYPQLTDPPRFRGPVIERNTFYFTCDLTFSGNDPDQAFEFVWLFDGVEDPKVPPEVISYPWQYARLDGAKLAGLLNKNVSL
ncbi:hypothetical protein C0Q70_21405 [Pomacea canaliculata]|uniref:EGF-like domain-containing protein n=1 Tax=Pomacea canaliculata TaxID=400727 RepID=A0A2T7NCF1_POMCA|nr:hypothetical protein C0Q70_21405 [Pomacea canaliculata]